MKTTIFSALAILLTISAVVFAGVSRDANGWTVVSPSVDTKIIYVSSSAGNDNYSGLAATSPVASISKGLSLLRAGHPDWAVIGDVVKMSR
jgi:hypothetical protein